MNMQVAQKRKYVGCSADGQVFVEFALVLPLFVLAGLAAVQLVWLGIATVRLQAAAEASARAIAASLPLERAAFAAAWVMAPVAPNIGGAPVELVGQSDTPIRKPLVEGTKKLPYALAHIHLRQCVVGGDSDSVAIGSVAFAGSGDSVRVRVLFAMPLLVPLVHRWFAEPTMALGPLPGSSGPLGMALFSAAGQARERFRTTPKRGLTATAAAVLPIETPKVSMPVCT